MRTGNRRCKGLRLRELGPSSEPSAVGLEDQTVGGGRPKAAEGLDVLKALFKASGCYVRSTSPQ